MSRSFDAVSLHNYCFNSFFKECTPTCACRCCSAGCHAQRLVSELEFQSRQGSYMNVSGMEPWKLL